MASRFNKSERAEAIDRLRDDLAESGHKTNRGIPIVYMILASRAASGMSRVIKPYVAGDNSMYWIGFKVAKATGLPFNEKAEGIVLRGTGMDMGFALAEEISRAVYGEPGRVKHEWL